MQSVLQNEFLLHEIFQFLEPDKKECYNAALTCCIFRKPVQDILWCCVDCGILPLFQLLFNLESCPDGAQNGKIWFLNGAISTVDLDRLKLFGRRICCLDCSRRKQSWVVDASAYVVLVYALQGQNLFPNLQHLFWHLIPKDSSGVLQLFYSSRLTEVEITGNTQNSCASDVLVYLQGLLIHQPPLFTLSITMPCTQALLNFIPTSYSHLGILHLDASPTTVIDHLYLLALSKLPRLYQLDLEVYNFNFPGDELSKICFQDLERLSVSCPFEQNLVLLSHCTFPSLYTFVHTFTAPTDTRNSDGFDYAKLFDSVHLSTSPHLKELYLAPCKNMCPDRYNRFLRDYTGVPFSTFSEALLQLDLIVLGLEFQICSSLTIDDFKAIITAWPRMIFLHIHCASQPSVDLSVLEVIQEGLPNLKDLSININAHKLRVIKGVPKAFFHGLTKLSVKLTNWSDSVTEVGRFVSYVDALFPCLKEIVELSFDDDRYHRASNRGDERRMTTFLNQLHLVRKIERDRQGLKEMMKPLSNAEVDVNGTLTTPRPVRIKAGSSVPVALY